MVEASWSSCRVELPSADWALEAGTLSICSPFTSVERRIKHFKPALPQGSAQACRKHDYCLWQFSDCYWTQAGCLLVSQVGLPQVCSIVILWVRRINNNFKDLHWVRYGPSRPTYFLEIPNYCSPRPNHGHQHQKWVWTWLALKGKGHTQSVYLPLLVYISLFWVNWDHTYLHCSLSSKNSLFKKKNVSCFNVYWQVSRPRS